MLPLRKFIFLQWMLLSLAIPGTSISSPPSKPMVKPGCPTHCGNVAVPYPFGIGQGGVCSMSLNYSILCNTSFNPPKPLYLLNYTESFFSTPSRWIEIIDISIGGQMRIKNNVVVACYGGGKQLSTDDSLEVSLWSFKDTPLQLSDTVNKLTVVGCDDYAWIGSFDDEVNIITSCRSSCWQPDTINGSCTGGNGCCDISIPMKFNEFSAMLSIDFRHTTVSNFNPCGYAFLAEKGKYIFNFADLFDPNFVNRTNENVPIVLDWVVGGNKTCEQAQKNSSSYACKKNSNCTDLEHSAGGYRCSCLPGFEGNPYLSTGCTESDECEGPNILCTHICTNIHGRFSCSCPHGQIGDGLKNGTGCVDHLKLITKLSLGLPIGLVSLLAAVFLTYLIITKRKIMKMRAKFFEQNGGLLLKQQLSQNRGNMEVCEIFKADVLRAASNYYSEDHIVGTGGSGTVYKGVLKDGREVAIKKSRVADQNQVEHFINELVILVQINHRNVVKLLGCCLETEVPLLVYEFMTHGTLFEHLHENTGKSWLSWLNCVRVAGEAAAALSYLHSAASVPIIHRDVKSTNILIDDRYTARISDFGASRFVPIDQTRVTTIVQGTLGYLDPEYYETSQLTEKSDVYSFGVVLAEILTKEQPLSFEREIEDRNLASYFVLSMDDQDQLFKILDPELVKEASKEHLLATANLIKKCLNVKGQDRPTMREVASELEALKNKISLLGATPNKNCQDIASSGDEQDLYPVL